MFVIEACLIRTPASKGAVDHYLVRLTLVHPFGHTFYRVFEKTQDGIQWRDIYANDPAWQVITRIIDYRLESVLERLRTAQAWTRYDLVLSNCEHFARYVMEGVDRSSQVVNGALFALGGLVLAGLAMRDS
jgi:hypothetical protein